MFGLFGQKKTLISLAKHLPTPELRKRTKILVVDDDKDAFPVDALKSEGYTIEYWPEVKSMDRLERGDFDIIVLDIAGVAQRISPDEDGLGVLQHLKSHNPTQIIVAFSGQSFDLSKQDFFKLADDTMPKPVTALKCMQVLDGLIESKMTVRHLWDTVVILMRAEGVPDKNIRKIETQMIQALKAGARPNMAELVSDVVGRSELAAKVIEVLTKIGSLCGL